MTFMTSASKFCLIGLLLWLGAVSSASAKDVIFQLDGREVTVFSPDRLGTAPAPLLIALHGAASNATEFRQLVALDATAEKLGFRIAYVSGSRVGWGGCRRSWKAGECCGPEPNGAEGRSHLISVVNYLAVFSGGEAVWLMGYSNGAMMAYRMACEGLPGLSGVVALSGPLAVQKCENARGIRILHIHGDADDVVPIAGTKTPNSHGEGPYLSAHQSLDRLRTSGASTELLVLKGAGHDYADLQMVSKSQTGRSLAAHIGGCLRPGPGHKR